MNRTTSRREPILGLGIAAARKVQRELGYEKPMDLEIEILAYLRGALVRPSPCHGARANLLRIGDRGIIGVAESLGFEERRWAIAHELGHFEAHADVSFLGLCSTADMLPSYHASGREPEANAFAAELLMPEALFRPRCDVARPSWSPIRELAEEYAVSVTAAALRFVAFSDERLAVVAAKDGVVAWSSGTKDFGPRPRKGARVKEWTCAHDFFAKGKVHKRPETVTASAWIDSAEDDEEVVEHVFAIPRLKYAMSLLWWRG